MEGPKSKPRLESRPRADPAQNPACSPVQNPEQTTVQAAEFSWLPIFECKLLILNFVSI
jgi:hypothetical protein